MVPAMGWIGEWWGGGCVGGEDWDATELEEKMSFSCGGALLHWGDVILSDRLVAEIEWVLHSVYVNRTLFHCVSFYLLILVYDNGNRHACLLTDSRYRDGG